jgi:CheY-like chemotaxis protein
MGDISAVSGDLEVRVLVVDDHVDDATSLALLLQLLGCKTAVAFGGDMCLRLIELVRPAIVFLDLNMPGVNGCEVLATARQMEGIDPRTIFVCVTGDSDPDVERRCLAAGFDRLYRKPIDMEALAEVLRRARHQ